MTSHPESQAIPEQPEPAPIRDEATPISDSRHNSFTAELRELIKARFPIIQIATHEEERALAEIDKIAAELKHRVMIWSTSGGVYQLPFEDRKILEKTSKFAQADLALALEMLVTAAEKQKHPLLLVLLDPDPYLTEKNANPIYRRKLREVAINIRTKGYMASCLIVSPIVNIPLELEKEITVLDFPLPDRDEIHQLIGRVFERFRQIKTITVSKDNGLEEAFVDAALGLTLHEIESCLARSIVTDQALNFDDVQKIIRQKQLIVRKSGLLEFFDTSHLSQDQVGGLAALKEWLRTREAAFSTEGRKYGIANPKGVLLTGVPGCGKSLSAKCIAASWHLPLIRLDVGKLYSRWVGSSEENIRSAIATAEAIAPCVLWIDEIEKGMPRNEGHVGDNGVSMRVFASFLTWLQEKTAPVFVFATANQIDLLAPEVLRKGRFDEIFFVDLPTAVERREILEIHLKKIGRVPDDFPMDELVRLSGEEVLGEGVSLSGAEIEAWVNESLIYSFYRGKLIEREKPALTLEDFRTIINRFNPLARIRREEIQKMRVWAKSHALNASVINQPSADSGEGVRLPSGRRISPE